MALDQLPKEDRLYRMRHSAAHIMAEAVLEMFPEAKFAIGPPIDNGFYYDFDLPRALTPEDLPEIERRMRARMASDVPFEHGEMSKGDALRQFRDQPFKVELIEGIAGDRVSLYRQGDFLDLCEGPHVERTGQVPAFKLTSVAGAYWRGDEKRPMLQRIYGALFETQEELDDYLHRLEEAQRRDHRKLGRELELYATSELLGSGLPMLLPKGATVRRLLEEYILAQEREAGYQHVYTPDLGKVELYKTSGHWDHYQENMYPPMALEHEEVVLRPMNCPHHILVFQQKLHSYRDLPVRIAEIGKMYRYERSGVVGGLSRVRVMALNDAHIFCRVDQIKGEFAGVMRLIERAYATLGITDYAYRLSLRDPADTEKYVQNDAMWELGERILRETMDELGLPYVEGVGEAAFYGPKLDVQLRDTLGREETISTIQIDFHLPEQFRLEYVDEESNRQRPVIVHRGIIGTLERMMAYLIELYAGAFPTWLAPVQAIVIPIADRHSDYAHKVRDDLRAAGLRAEVDTRNERMNAKIRDAQLQKIPYMLVVGDREAEAEAVSVRTRAGEDLKSMPVFQFIDRLRDEVATALEPESAGPDVQAPRAAEPSGAG
ncbi:MAG TPA: threonine--tRNA ligase [Dehalococcoidia bacterium]|nr:threonine--tRNA ligase [Dehalococcoidia bacterium]